MRSTEFTASQSSTNRWVTKREEKSTVRLGSWLSGEEHLLRKSKELSLNPCSCVKIQMWPHYTCDVQCHGTETGNLGIHTQKLHNNLSKFNLCVGLTHTYTEGED